MKTMAFVILTGLLFQSIACAPINNAKGQEVRHVSTDDDFFAHAKETMSPEEYAKVEAARKQALEMARKAMEAARARMGRPRVRMANGGDPKKVIWPTVEEYVAQAKDSVSPEDLEKLKASYSEMLEQVKNGTAEIEILSTDSEGRVNMWTMTSSSIVRAEKPDKP
jgi:F0F1-type ATP synthase membrane subunit b/b'